MEYHITLLQLRPAIEAPGIYAHAGIVPQLRRDIIVNQLRFYRVVIVFFSRTPFKILNVIVLLVSIILIVILAKFKGDVQLDDTEALGSFKPIGIIALVLLLVCIISMIYTCIFLF